MHILLIIISAIGGIAFWIWRTHMAARAASELKDTAEELVNLPRKMRFRSKSKKRSVDLIDDPMEAAATLAYGALTAAGPIDPEQKTALSDRLAEMFQLNSDDLHELISRAKWHAESQMDINQIINPLIDRLINDVGREPVFDLTRLIEEICVESRREFPDQNLYIGKMKRHAGLA